VGLNPDEAISSDLSAYVNAPDANVRWESLGADRSVEVLRVRAQSWRGIEWVHHLAVVGAARQSDVALLYITGGEPNSLDLADAERLGDLSGFETAMLFDMPNQPIFDLSEDALIAHTFDRFLETGDATWPLLFPMVKSVVRAMDALQAWSQGRLARFILIGESKRAWTTWLTACTLDPRIIGIVPTVFDNLNMTAQLAHQHEIWDEYSTAIHDYTDLGLPARAQSHLGRRLSQMVDPFLSLKSINVPLLQINGSNDEYWAPDARSLYEEWLPEASSLLTLANEGHVFTDKLPYYRNAASFARRCAAGLGFPKLVNKLTERNELLVNLILSVESAEFCTHCRLFLAESPDGKFAQAEWWVESQCRPGELLEFCFALPELREPFQAAFVQADIDLGGGEVVTVSGTTILRRC